MEQQPEFTFLTYLDYLRRRYGMTEFPFTIQFRFSEFDVSMDLRRGYENEEGDFVDGYTDEEWEKTMKEAEGKKKIRLVMLCGHLQTALESAWFEESGRAEALTALMAGASQVIQRIPPGTVSAPDTRLGTFQVIESIAS